MKNGLSKEKLIEMYAKMLRIRHFEDRVYRLFLTGTMPGTIHLSQGQEAIAVGVCANLSKDDIIIGTHRSHGEALAKGVSMKLLMAELFARSNGCCKGKGGSMHVGDPAVGMIPATGIVASGIPLATGVALAFKMKRLDQVVVCFFGEGASNEGAFHEGINMGAIWNLPVIYVCENNLYGASTHISKVVKIKNIADRASSYGIPGVVVDGNDVLAVYEKTGRAVERTRKGKGPTLIECKTYRRGGHSRSDPGNYRDKQGEKFWLAKDPVSRMKKKLIQMNILTAEGSKKMEDMVEDEINEAIEFGQKSPSPKPEDTLKDVFV